MRSPERGIVPRYDEQHASETPFQLTPIPEGARAALRLLDSSVTHQAITRDPAAGETRHPSRAVVVAGGQALVRAARRSVLERAGLEVSADVEDASRAAKAAELYTARLVL